MTWLATFVKFPIAMLGALRSPRRHHGIKIKIGDTKKMKKIIDIDEKFLEAARAALAKKMPWEKNITAKQTVNAALSFYAAYANKKG